MLNDKGEQFKIEIPRQRPDRRSHRPRTYHRNLRKIGIDASLRIVDSGQYVNRYRNFDFDVRDGGAGSVAVARQRAARVLERRKAADTPGSRNLSGIKDPVVDALVERVIFATDRDDLLAATHALDRVLLWNYYVVPQWHRAVSLDRLLEQVRLSRRSSRAMSASTSNSWWIDPAKEAALQAKYKSQN